jgi:ubiquinone/menaquinone biosynthesis C-methylase UbiE
MDHTGAARDLFDKRAKEYQDKYMNVDLYHASFDLFCSRMPTNAMVLELASGPGNITQYLLKKRPDLKIFGTDIAPNMVRLARQNNPEAQFEVMDGRDISKIDKKFDGIVCGFGLPYFSRENSLKLIADCAKLLVPGGVLYLSTMEDDYSKSSIQTSSQGDELFMYFHQADYLLGALKKNCLSPISLTRQDYPTGNEDKIIDLLIIAEKTNPSHNRK